MRRTISDVDDNKNSGNIPFARSIDARRVCGVEREGIRPVWQAIHHAAGVQLREVDVLTQTPDRRATMPPSAHISSSLGS